MSTRHSQSCRGDEHSTNGAAEASSSSAGVRVCACRQAHRGCWAAAGGREPDGVYDAAPAARPFSLVPQARSWIVLPSLPARLTVRAFSPVREPTWVSKHYRTGTELVETVGYLGT